MLSREFYLRDANDCAVDLLGKKLVHETDHGLVSGMIVEVESYIAPGDAASHAYNNKKTKRTEIHYNPGGLAYIYLIYGMYNCFNIVVNTEDKPEVILVRALEPIDGIEIMNKNRRTNKLTELCNGPGKLCQALSITTEQYGYDLCNSTLYLEEFYNISQSDILRSPRINIDYAGEAKDYLWRFYLKDNKFVSKSKNNALGVSL